jgi:hypothetical protein
MNDLSAEARAYIDDRINHGDERVRGWVMKGAIIHLLSIGGALFIMGNINANIEEALDSVQRQQAILEKRGARMMEMDRERYSLQDWAETKGYKMREKRQEYQP